MNKRHWTSRTVFLGSSRLKCLGNQYDFDDNEIGWIGEPITVEGKREAGYIQ